MKTETENNNLNKKPSIRRYIIAAVCFILLVVIALVVAALNNKSKPDPESERIIREAVARRLNKDPNDLTDKDYALFRIARISEQGSLISLDKFYLELRPNELSDIKLLEKCTKLQELQLISFRYPEKKIPKLIRYLGKFGVIDLDKRFAIDLSPLKNLSALKKLRLHNAQINDITPLKNLTNLEELYITTCPNITDKQVEELQKALPNLKIIR